MASNPPSSPELQLGDMHSLILLKEQEVANLRESALQKLEAQVGLKFTESGALNLSLKIFSAFCHAAC